MKSAIARYGYLNAKLRARLANLRDSNVIKNLIDAGTFLQALEALENTAYASLAAAYRETGDLQMMEKTLLDDEISMRREIHDALDGHSRNVAGFFLLKIEIDNLKNIIRIWYDTTVLGGNSGYRLNYIIREKILSDISWDAVINASSWEQILTALGNAPCREVLARFKKEDLEKDGLAYMEMALDCWYYQGLMAEVAKLGHKDRDVAYSVLERDLDIKNILILIRYGFYYNVELKRLQSMMLPGGQLYSDRKLALCFGVSDGLDRIQAFLVKRYPKLNLGHIFSYDDKMQLLSRSLELEYVLADEREVNYKRIMRGDPFSIGLIMAYFFKYDRFDNSIRLVLHGKYYHWSDDRILEVLK